MALRLGENEKVLAVQSEGPPGGGRETVLVPERRQSGRCEMTMEEWVEPEVLDAFRTYTLPGNTSL